LRLIPKILAASSTVYVWRSAKAGVETDNLDSDFPVPTLADKPSAEAAALTVSPSNSVFNVRFTN
jgi:hypothetical protein